MKNKNTHIAYICSGCDDYRIFNVNIFDFSGSRQKIFSCDCKKSELKITKNSTKSFKIELYCPICKEVHSYMVPFNQFFSDDVFVFSCLYYEADLLFIGNKEKLMAKLNEYTEQIGNFEEEHIVFNHEELSRMVDLSKIVYNSPEKINICDCKSTYSVAYNEKGIYIICDKCNYALPVSFDRIDMVLDDILNEGDV